MSELKPPRLVALRSCICHDVQIHLPCSIATIPDSLLQFVEMIYQFVVRLVDEQIGGKGGNGQAWGCTVACTHQHVNFCGSHAAVIEPWLSMRLVGIMCRSVMLACIPTEGLQGWG